MFFEPAAAGGATVTRRLPETPARAGPPVLETGVLLPAQRTVARSENVVVLLLAARVFTTGGPGRAAAVVVAGQQRRARPRGTRLPPVRAVAVAPAAGRAGVQWPAGGIGLTIADLDGAAIAEAGSRPSCYWPGWQPGRQ